MGIKNGSTIINFVQRGLYNKNPKTYNILVDGELMRYKGMNDDNITKHNTEEAIAATSYDYLRRTIKTIELWIGRKTDSVIVYMDGARVLNKVTNRADFDYDAALIRTVFKMLCREHGYTVIELDYGESELQMYLNRNKSNDLNILLTNDSDILSICYDHRPTITANNDENQTCFDPKRDSIAQSSSLSSLNDTKNNVDSILDSNLIYPSHVKVTDSCVWINTDKKNLTAIGFDYIAEYLGYKPFAFRTFVALCGTDFTDNLFTKTTMCGILSATDEDKEFINSLTDVNEIAAALQMVGLRGNGRIKNLNANNTDQFNADDIKKCILMYIEYITTGHMPNERMPRMNMSIVCRQYLYAMKNQNDNFVHGTLVTWARRTKLEEAIKSLNLYLGTYAVKQKIVPQKRSRTVAEMILSHIDEEEDEKIQRKK